LSSGDLLKNPELIYIATFQEGKSEDGSTSVPKAFQEIVHHYKPVYSETEDAYAFGIGSSEAYVRISQEGDLWAIMMALKSKVGAIQFSQIQTNCEDDMRAFTQLLPRDPISLSTLRIASVKGLGEIKSLVLGYADGRGKILRCMGKVHDCVVSTLESQVTDGSTSPLRREMIIVPLSRNDEGAASSIWMLTRDVFSLTSYTAMLGHLRSGRELMLNQVDASEETTQLRIDEILMELRRPKEQLKPEVLESPQGGDGPLLAPFCPSKQHEAGLRKGQRYPT